MVIGITIRIERVEVSRKSIILVLLILLLSMYPFVIEIAGPMEFYLGLPAWYWISTAILAIIYAFSAYLVLHGQKQEDRAIDENEELTEVTNHG